MKKKNRKRRGSMGAAVSKYIKTKGSSKDYIDSIPNGFKMFTPQGGKTYKFNILPYVIEDLKNHPEKKLIPEDIWYRYAFKKHSNIGPNKTNVICPSVIGKKCPICEERQAIYDDPEQDNDLASALYASPRSIFVIQFTAGKNKGEIFLMEISDYCFFDAVSHEIDISSESDYNNFADLEGGYTLEVRFKAEKFGKNEFAMTDRVDFRERDDIDEDIFDEIPCLDSMIAYPTYKQIEALFNGMDDDEDLEPDYKDEDEEKSEPPKLDWDDLQDMDEEELLEVSEAEELGLDEDDYDDEDELRDIIAGELEIEKPKKKKKKKKDKVKKDKKDKKESAREKADKKKADKKKKKKGKKTGSTKKALKCPFAHQFGDDFEDYPECDEDECESYEACMEKFSEDE